MDVHSELVKKIISAQERIIGPLAVEQAKKVHGLSLDWSKKNVTIEGDKKKILDELVKQYEHLFGQTSVEVCRDAVKNMLDDIPKDQLPPVLAS
jgi:hypothetical protein